MRMRVLVMLFAAVAISIVGVMLGLSKSKTKAPAGVSDALVNTGQQGSKRIANDPPGTIEGAKNPELISDQMAYSLLFRFLSGRRTEAEKNLARSYINQMALGDADALLVAADEYGQRVGVLDRRAKEIRDLYRLKPNANAKTQLAELQEKKEAIVAEIVNSLAHRLGGEDAERVRQHINDRVKRKVKIFPEQP